MSLQEYALVRLMVQSLKVVTILAMAVIVAIGGRQFFDYYLDQQADPLTGRLVQVSISEDETSDAIATKLHDGGLIRSEAVFTTQLRLTSGQLRPGDYSLRRGMSVAQIVDRISDDGDTDEDEAAAASDVSNEPAQQVTIPEGLRIEQIANLVGDTGLIEGGADAFIEATQEDWTSQYDFLADNPTGSIEGYLFPDTYTISPAMNAEDVVAAMLDLFGQKVTPEMRSRADAMGLTMHQVVTLASIVERETADAGERDEIAATYLNRLESEVTNFRLEADPTVQYVLGTPAEWWPVIEPDVPRSAAADSLYNTYTNQGIPPGPICNPGVAAISAVLEPAEVDYLFFVAKDDGTGTHVFASTYEEHLQNIEIYQNSDAG
jgi:UPF0755 protein